VQLPSWKESHLLDASRLLDGMKNGFNLYHQIGPNAAAGARLVEAFQPLVPETSDAHAALYGITVRRSNGNYIPSGPRLMATTPVRETSIRPSGSIRLTKLSILSEAPVISNTKLSLVASTTRARKASARRSASMR